jgi:pyrimidine-nucleoside phosphorylase
VSIPELIAKKRDGGELTPEEIAQVVREFMRGALSEGQMGALLMAIFLRGLTARETTDLTLAMMRSGDTLDLSRIPGIKVDKHSTGGVGDKTTLVVAPLVAALGVPVPKMAGRALGHTGGTIDKLECIPGLTTELTPTRFCRQVADIGLAIASQSHAMTPADGRIYALRDATGTVESVPLIAASVMSKKLAVGADALVLDVKAGGGAFMDSPEQARELAQVMVQIGVRAGKRVTAIITRMDQPLGAAVGDAVELGEAVATLTGDGPADFTELCEIIAGHMLALGGKAPDPAEGRSRAREALRSGVGLGKLKEMVRAQGGDARVLDDPAQLLAESESLPVSAAEQGYVTGVDARQIGLAIRDLKAAAGERHHQCGVLVQRKCGEAVGQDPVALLIVPSGMTAAAEEAARAISRAFQAGPRPLPQAELVLAVIQGGAG